MFLNDRKHNQVYFFAFAYFFETNKITPWMILDVGKKQISNNLAMDFNCGFEPLSNKKLDGIDQGFLIF